MMRVIQTDADAGVVTFGWELHLSSNDADFDKYYRLYYAPAGMDYPESKDEAEIPADDFNRDGSNFAVGQKQLTGLDKNIPYIATMRFFDDEFGEDEMLCESTVSFNLYELGEYDSNYKSGQAAFTLFSGRCLDKAKDLDIGAFKCVVVDGIYFLLSFVGIISTTLVAFGGLRIIASHNEDGRNAGKKILTYAIIGLIVVLLSYVFVQIILGGGIIFN